MFQFALFGVVFGFILERIGATEFETIFRMFTLEDLHLAGTIGVAIVVTGLGFQILRRRGIACADGCPATLAPKPVKPGLIVGSAIFGAGWALTGTCPGTGLAQIGEGKLVALFTVSGMLLGAALYGGMGRHIEGWLSAVRRSLRRPGRSHPPEDAWADPAS